MKFISKNHGPFSCFRNIDYRSIFAKELLCHKMSVVIDAREKWPKSGASRRYRFSTIFGKNGQKTRAILGSIRKCEQETGIFTKQVKSLFFGQKWPILAIFGRCVRILALWDLLGKKLFCAFGAFLPGKSHFSWFI